MEVVIIFPQGLIFHMVQIQGLRLKWSHIFGELENFGHLHRNSIVGRLWWSILVHMNIPLWVGILQELGFSFPQRKTLMALAVELLSSFFMAWSTIRKVGVKMWQVAEISSR